jgi:hypothetical protein
MIILGYGHLISHAYGVSAGSAPADRAAGAGASYGKGMYTNDRYFQTVFRRATNNNYIERNKIS